MLKIVYSVVIIIGFASTAFATRCNICSTLKDQHCEDPFKSVREYEKHCDEVDSLTPGVNYPPCGCLKMKWETPSGRKAITRTCSFGYYADTKKECNITRNNIKYNLNLTSCYTCAGDLCNSSTTTGVFATLVTLFAVLVRVMS